MVNTGRENQEVMKRFFSGEMSEEERLKLLDYPDTVELLCKPRALTINSSGSKDSSKNIEKTTIEKIEDLIKQGEINFAIDLIKGLGEDIPDYERFLEDGKIFQTGVHKIDLRKFLTTLQHTQIDRPFETAKVNIFQIRALR